MSISEFNKREYTTVPNDISHNLKEDAKNSGRGSVSKEIAYILKIYYENKEKIQIIIK